MTGLEKTVAAALADHLVGAAQQYEQEARRLRERARLARIEPLTIEALDQRRDDYRESILSACRRALDEFGNARKFLAAK